ncbi:variable large family protein [Borreliella turdi]|uniref:variable large family protein n=1 Tax=Borreliella turdi TaxID=57863 RepID=UPI0012488AD0|nr:variable large family protein [Borreliella turdi]
MKKISSAIFTITFLVFINCKSDTRKAINPIQTQKFISFDRLIDGFLSLKPTPKKSEVKDYFNSMAKTLNKAKDKFAKFISEKGGKTIEGKNTDTAKEDSNTVNPVDDEINKINDMIDKMIDAANTIVETVAETTAETMGEVVEVKSSDNVSTKADAKSVVEIAKGIKKIVGAAGIADKLKAEADNPTKPIIEESNNKEAGKMFSGKQGHPGGRVFYSYDIPSEIGGGANPEDINKAAEAISAVSGEQILGAIIAAAETVESSGATEGKNADEATNPIEAAIGGNDNSDATAFRDNMEKDTQIAAAIVLRGMAKNGKFAVKMGREPSGDGNTIRALVKNAANKTVDALSKLVLKAINESLTKIAKTIKAS